MKPVCCAAILALSLYLGIHNGYLALFDSEDALPREVLPYKAEVYPKIDQNALQDGIDILSPTHLKQLLEDFLA